MAKFNVSNAHDLENDNVLIVYVSRDGNDETVDLEMHLTLQSNGEFAAAVDDMCGVLEEINMTDREFAHILVHKLFENIVDSDDEDAVVEFHRFDLEIEPVATDFLTAFRATHREATPAELEAINLADEICEQAGFLIDQKYVVEIINAECGPALLTYVTVAMDESFYGLTYVKHLKGNPEQTTFVTEDLAATVRMICEYIVKSTRTEN